MNIQQMNSYSMTNIICCTRLLPRMPAAIECPLLILPVTTFIPKMCPSLLKMFDWRFESRDPDYSVTDETRILSGEGEIIWVEVRFRVKRGRAGEHHSSARHQPGHHRTQTGGRRNPEHFQVPFRKPQSCITYSTKRHHSLCKPIRRANFDYMET